jgi:nucleoside-diphosphate-sugar epimerase
MNIFVSGASGLVGMAVTRALLKRGHTVEALTRSEANAQRLRAISARPLVSDLDDDSAYSAAARADVIVHAAQGRFYDRRVNDKVLEENTSRDRRWSLRLLEAGRGRAETFVYVSGAWVYGDGGDTLLTEDAATRPLPAGQGKLDVEVAVQAAARQLGYTSCVVSRPGFVYGVGSAFELFVLAPMLAKKSAKWIGSGSQWVSLIHAEDLGEMLTLAIEKKPGYAIFNGADDEPTTPAAYMSLLAQLLSAKAPGGVPTFIVSAFAGHMAKAIAASVRLSNARAKEVLGFAPRFPSYREGMRDLALSVLSTETTSVR